MTWFDESRLDDESALRTLDARLRVLAESGARIRREAHDAAAAVAEALGRAEQRPRAVVAAGPDSRLLRAVLEPWCPVPFVAGSTAEANFNAGTNNTARGTSSLTATFINGANEAAVAPYANLKSVHAFFDNTSYIGAVKDANDTWWQGWTCNLTADKPC